MSVEKRYLLSTLWTQYGKVISCGNNDNLEDGLDYNEYAPFDKNFSEDNSYTGCTATATSQIIYYHLLNNFQNDLGYKLKLDVLTEQDAYVSHADIPEATVYISANGGGDGETLSFAEINSKLSAFVPVPTTPAAGDYNLNSLKAAEYIAALNFSVGVMLKAAYSSVWGTAAVYSAEPFLRFGFKSAYEVNFNEMYDAEASLWITQSEEFHNLQLTDEAIEILIENVKNGAPVTYTIPGHAIVLDGYNDEADLFHLNYGWGPENSQPEDKKGTRWYTREEFRQLGTVGFVIDASPVFQEFFTVTDNRVFGSGTLYRAIQQAIAMQGANIITFDDALEQADALELPIHLALKDKTTISGFNMTIFAGENDVDGENAETVNEDEDGSDDGSEEEEENTGIVVAFSGEQGSQTEFTDFKGNIIVNSAQKMNCAAFNFSEAVQLTISTDNANIYAGVSQFEHADILDKMSSGDVDELLENVQKKVAVVGSEGDDQVTLDDETIVIGNIELDAGHDSLAVSGNSTVYGDIDMGSGDNMIKISAGSSIHGNLSDETELCITLTGETEEVLFNITGDAAGTFENITSITIDATDAEMEEYILFNTGNLETLLAKLVINGEGGIITADDGSIRWSANDGYTTEAEEEDDMPDKIIGAGEILTNGAVGAEEQWLFQDGSIATGSLSIAEDGEVKVMTGAEFIFDISAMSEENQSCTINNFDGINGTFHFSIKTALDQAEGCYILAQNVTEWCCSSTITVTAGKYTLGTFKDGEDEKGFSFGDKHYSLVYDENQKSLSFVIESAFQTAVKEDGSIELAWHKPAAATGYFVNISRSDKNGVIEIFSAQNALNIVTAAAGEYEWQAIAPELETEYREGGDFSIDETKAENTGSSLFDAGENDEVVDIFIAESSGIWGEGYLARHVELPQEWKKHSEICTEVNLNGKNRYADIFNGVKNDSALLYLSDSENGDALFLDDVYSAFPDSEKCERLSYITSIYAGGGDDIIDLTSDKFNFAGKEVKIYGGDGDDVVWTGKDSSSYLYGDRGDDCLIGSGSDDCFIGGAGDDVIFGGGGKDLFAYGDPSTWGNDIIYQLPGDENGVQLFFEQEELELQTDRNGDCLRITVDGAENSSITVYFKKCELMFGHQCNQFENIFAGGGCGEFASQNIFEDNDKGTLA